jgi:hypothetical protein
MRGKRAVEVEAWRLKHILQNELRFEIAQGTFLLCKVVDHLQAFDHRGLGLLLQLIEHGLRRRLLGLLFSGEFGVRDRRRG